MPLRFGLAGQCLGFFDRLVPLRMGGDQHTPVVDADQPVSNRNFDGFDGEPHADLVKLRSETDLPVATNLASCQRLYRCGLNRFAVVVGSETEPFPRHNITNPLMTTLEIVFPHPAINLGLGVLDTDKHLAV